LPQANKECHCVRRIKDSQSKPHCMELKLVEE